MERRTEEKADAHQLDRMLSIGRYTARWNRHLPRHRGALHAIQVGSTASQAGENVRPNEYERPNEYR